MFYQAHPHTFLLIEALLEVQGMSYLKMRSSFETEKVDPKEAIIEEYMTRHRQIYFRTRPITEIPLSKDLTAFK